VTVQQSVLAVRPVERPVDATVSLPGSKSYTNRALIIAAMAGDESLVRSALFSDDTDYMASALRTLGIAVEEDAAAASFRVAGGDGRIPVPNAELFVGNAGTAARFLTAFVATGQGRYVVDGNERMRQRPIQPLLDALQQLNVRASAQRGNGCPPVLVDASGLSGGKARIPGQISSQYFSALLMVGPLSHDGIELEVEGELVSKPYTEMTLSTMRAFGAEGSNEEFRRFRVPGGQRYNGRVYDVEPDASGASYFFAAAAVTGGRVRVLHLGKDSAQGDLHFVDLLERMGCSVNRAEDYTEVTGTSALGGIEADMADISDTAQTLAAIAPFANAPVTIRGIAHVRGKETDRVAAMATELRRLGQRVDERPDGLTIHPAPVVPAEVQTYDDHRMAMSFAVTGLRAPGVRIKDPGCVSKTFPDFWERFEELQR
jgi:3-phosphoshikimate 1-carboxyvinyltransferase